MIDSRRAVLFVAVLAALVSCNSQASPRNRHPAPAETPHLAPGVASSTHSAPAGAIPRKCDHGEGSHHKTCWFLNQHVPGDGLGTKMVNPCSNMPFPGPIIRAYEMHECWLGYWGHPTDGNLMFMPGYRPGSHHRNQVMLVGAANAPVREVALQNGHGVAFVRAWGRACAVIAYAKSSMRQYYEPYRHRFVEFCRWRR